MTKKTLLLLLSYALDSFKLVLESLISIKSPKMVLKTVLARFERFFLMIIVILANFINSHYRLDSYFIYVILLTVFVIIRTIMRNSEILDTVNMIFDPLWAWCRYWQYKIYRHQGIFQTDQNFGFYGHFNLRGNKKHHVYKLSNGLSNLLHFSHV